MTGRRGHVLSRPLRDVNMKLMLPIDVHSLAQLSFLTSHPPFAADFTGQRHDWVEPQSLGSDAAPEAMS